MCKANKIPTHLLHIFQTKVGILRRFDKKSTHDGLTKGITLSFKTFTKGKGPSTNENEKRE